MILRLKKKIKDSFGKNSFIKKEWKIQILEKSRTT